MKLKELLDIRDWAQFCLDCSKRDLEELDNDNPKLNSIQKNLKVHGYHSHVVTMSLMDNLLNQLKDINL